MSRISKTFFTLLLIFILVFPAAYEVLALGQPPVPDKRPSFVPYDSTLTIVATSETSTSNASLPNSGGSNVPVAIGETITYRLVVEVSEGTSTDVQVTDTLVPNIEFIPGSARISYSANNPMNIPSMFGIVNEVNPTTTFPLALISFGVMGPRELRFDIGQVVNNDTDNSSSAELLIIEYQAVVVNTSDNVLGATWGNTFEVDADNDGTDDDTSNSVFSVVREPVLSVDKSINTTLSNPAGGIDFRGGDTVVYDLLVTGGNAVNQTTAFDLQVIDVIHVDLDLVDVDFIGAPAYVATSDNSDYTLPGQSVSVTISELRPGDTITVRVTTTVRNSVTKGQVIGNTASLTWTSLPGLQGTGDAAPGNSGDTNGERNGDTTGENDYRAANNFNFTVGGVWNSIKSIVATSETSTSDASLPNTGSSNVPVVIGERITYRAMTELDESTTISLRLDDVLPVGIDFVPGSAQVSYLADTLPSLAGDFVGIQNESNPSLPFPAGRITFDGGTRTLSFDFGSIINNDGDGDAEYFVLEFDAVVVDNVVNTSGDILQNDFDTVADQFLPTETIETSNQVNVVIVEPGLTIAKTFAPNIQVRGENVTMTLVVGNLAANGATASIFDLNATDTLDDWLNITAVDVSFNAAALSFGSSHTNNSTITPGFSSGVTDQLNISISGLPVGGVATIEVTLQIDPNADSLLLSRTITNIANVTGDSLASDITPDDEDRSYIDNAADDLDVVKPTLLVTKTDSIDPVAAGALMNYTVTIQNTGTPNFAATNVTFTDQLPTGFNVTLVTPSQGTCSPVSGNMLTCQLGTIASGANANVVIAGSYNATTLAGTIRNNIVYVSSDEGNNGNDGNDTPTDGDDERAEEPTTILRQSNVAIAKTVNDAEPVEGQTVRYALAVSNSGTSQATNVIVTDNLPVGVTFVEFLPATLPCVYAAPTLTCTFPIVNVNEEKSITIRATVDAGTLGSTITNTATVTSTEPDTILTNNMGGASIKVVTDNTSPTVTANSLVASYGTGPISFKIVFSEELENFGNGSNADDVTNPANYLLVENGNNDAFDTVSCGPVPGSGGLKADDSQMTVNSVSYDPVTFTVTVSINGNTPLPGGEYRLFVCGTTSIVDLANNELNGRADYIFDFTVLSNISDAAEVKISSLPKTGFAPNRITSLPPQPANFKYGKLDSIWVEIPVLNVDSEIVGVPMSPEGGWDVTWLGNSTGWLNGTAFPTWEGNSVLTAHVTNANGLAGPFANIKSLKYGDRVIVHMSGEQYIYEVRDTRLVRPHLTSFAFQDLEGYSYLTLITCAGYNEDTEEYAFRRVVRTVLVEIKAK